jgi:hypothetical protein
VIQIPVWSRSFVETYLGRGRYSLATALFSLPAFAKGVGDGGKSVSEAA